MVIDPTISQAGVIAWTIGGFVVGFLLLKGKHKMKLTKPETLDRINSDCNFQNDMRELIGTAFKCKLSAINLMIAYCDANGFTYSNEFSSHCLNCYHDLKW